MELMTQPEQRRYQETVVEDKLALLDFSMFDLVCFFHKDVLSQALSEDAA